MHRDLLFAYGLGEGRPSSWRERLGPHAYPSPSQMVGEQLRWAAAHGFLDRVRLLLANGVDPDTRGCHPVYGSQSSFALAVHSGHSEIADLLRAAGAENNVKD